MRKERMQTKKQHAYAQKKILELIDAMIVLLAKQRNPSYRYGLCHVLTQVIDSTGYENCWPLPIKIRILNDMRALMQRHIRPARSKVYWWGLPGTSKGHKIRKQMLLEFREKVAAGDIFVP